MIKAVFPAKENPLAKEKASQEYEALKNFYNVKPTIDLLMT